jgi:hypothetical protein
MGILRKRLDQLFYLLTPLQRIIGLFGRLVLLRERRADPQAPQKEYKENEKERFL